MQDESELAERIARQKHAGQTEESTGDEYIRHIERVVALVEGEAKAAAWLHDVIEDTDTTAEYLLSAGISDRTVRAVLLLTRIKETETYAAYIERLNDSGDAVAIRVKIADLKDHLRPNCPPRLRPRYENAWSVLVTEPATSAAQT